VTHRHSPPVPGLDGPPEPTTLSRYTPPTTANGASLHLCEEPASNDRDEQWDTMLTRLAIDRARHLLEDAIGTLEQLVPTTGTPLDSTLRHLRSALRRLVVP
jgi:hypothetical protein